MIRIPLIIGLLITALSSLTAQDNSREKYIERFQKIAISEMERAGIPASIKLAQGILESNGGKSTLARKANNHFGIKCHNDWKGKGYYLEDDDYDDNGKLIKSCFRVYKNADASYIAHSEFLRDPKKRYRYGPLFNLNPRDYKAWARGLKKAGYATSPTYAEKLIRIIESYKLYRFDEMSSIDTENNTRPDLELRGIELVNQVKMTISKLGETPVTISERTGIPVSRIVKYNEKITSKTQKIGKETRVYLQRKRNNFRGKQKWHYVKSGETMFDISQRYGVKVSKLYSKNRLSKGSEPAEGEKIKISGWFKISKKRIPKTRSKGEMEELEELDENGETPIEIEIPVSSNDDEDFGEDITPELPDEDIIIDDNPVDDDPIFIDPEPDTNPDVDTNPDTDQPPSTGVFYTVQKGDTLFSISRRYGTTVEGIKRLNQLDSNTLSVGQRLRIF